MITVNSDTVRLISLDPGNDSAYIVNIPVLCEHSRPITVYCPYCEAEQ